MLRSSSLRAACAVALVVTASAVAGCGEETPTGGGSQGSEHEAHREGLAIPFEGLEYNVLITRQLNVHDPEDRGYLIGPESPPGSAAYGVFLRACNTEEKGEPRTAASTFRIVDSQGNHYEPRRLEPDNVFAYRSRELGPRQCIPTIGSLADNSPTGGALLVFELPQEAVENRPLELEILQGFDVEAGAQKAARVELDI